MVVLPAYGVGDGVVTVIRDLAVAAYALRARGMHLEVLLLDDGTSEVASVAAKTAAEYGLPLTAISGPRSPAEAYVNANSTTARTCRCAGSAMPARPAGGALRSTSPAEAV
jgi:hypothetical protein